MGGIIAASILVQPATFVRAEAEASTSQLIITEVKANNDTIEGGLNEFVEIYNNSADPIDLNGYLLTYFNVYNPLLQTPIHQDFGGEVLGPYQYLVLARDTSQIEGSFELASIKSLKDAEGSLFLLGPGQEDNETNEIYDSVSWFKSSSTNPLPPGTNELPNADKSLQRTSGQRSEPIEFSVGWQDGLPTPFSYLFVEPLLLPPVNEITCEGVIINEILSNPAGSDVGREFIELYNPTEEAIDLAGCSLQTSSNNKKYTFVDITLQPGEYAAFDDTATGLTLANAAGGKVWLLSPSEELQAIAYPGGLDDDQAWSRFGEQWQRTYSPTPGQLNSLLAVLPCPAGQERSEETGLCRTITNLSGELLPCRADQERNPATNRCRLIQSVLSALTPCKPGQERNPETNRCRSVLGASLGLVPCKPGQTRNPETNRCRGASSSSSELKPCAAGQERNPATNRCRKVASAKSGVAGLSDVKDVSGSDVSNSSRWILAGLGVAGALGYAGYEWRREVLGFLSNIKSKFLGR